MAITFVNTGAGSGSAGNAAPGLPAGLAEHDLMMLHVEVDGTDVLATPDGWTIFPGYPFINGGACRSYVFYRRATASESGPTLVDAGDHICSIITAWRGVKRTGNPYNVIGSQQNGTSGSRSAPGATTTVDGCMVVASYAIDSTGANGSEANGDLTGVAERADFGTSAGGNGAVWVVSGIKTVAGAYGATTGSGGTLTWTAGSIALEPQPLVVAPAASVTIR